MENFSLTAQDIDAALTLIQLAAGEISRHDRTDDGDTAAPLRKSKRKRQSERDSLSPIKTREVRKSLQVCDKSDRCDDDVKANEEERSSDLISYITDDDDDELCFLPWKHGEREREREAEGSKSDTIDLWCGGDYLWRKKTKFRSLFDLYRTTPSL
ncbi:hypothetical protein Acr_06g0012580 [Actinidia rufa]|uniref:Uncharacterized protein n=1 Tax=Actinidia rufa TaxID=165716 RepID=A0A7J0ES70_9ERIC|nr:hypothetical protein Acr_06g0012580 [Actinidia rufa]